MNMKQSNHPAKKKPASVGLCLVLPSQEMREHFRISAMLQGENMTEAMLEMVRVYIAKGPNRPARLRAINKKRFPE